MAGARGKSRGCGTCRARKIACGQERPICAQCTKSKRECTGYQRDKVFVLVQPGAKDSSAVDKKRNSTPTQPPGPEESRGYEIIVNCHRRQQLFQCFIAQCLSHQRFRPEMHRRPWIFLLAHQPTKSGALEISMLATALAALGWRFQDRSLAHQSLIMYTRGLRELQAALWNNRSMRDDQTLAACLFLSLYELMECPGNGYNAYIGHCRGLLALIKARGVDAHTIGIGHELFLGVRFPAIIDALAHRVPNLLCESDWCQDPWTATPKRIADRIADCLAKTPFILQRYDRLECLSLRERTSLAQELVQECLALDRDLQNIYEELQLQSPGPLFWPVLSPKFPDHSPEEMLFPVNYHFPDLQTASILMLYWASRALVWSFLSNLCDILKTDDFDNITHDPHIPIVNQRICQQEHQQTYMIMSRNVCQSLEYCCQDKLSLIGMFVATTPVVLAMYAMRYRNQHNHPEFMWLVRVRKRMQKRLRLWQYI